jgi:hypothetical protein
MADREGRDDDDERPQAAERGHQADQEQQVIGAFENVPEARYHEAQRGLMPARIEMHEAGIAIEFEGPNGTAWRQEAQRRRHVVAETIEARVDRECRAVGPDRIFEQHVKQLLVPVEVEVVRDARARHMGAGACIGAE